MYTLTQKQAILDKVNIDAKNAQVGLSDNSEYFLYYAKKALIYKEYILLIQNELIKELSKIPHQVNSDGICDIDIIIDAMQLRIHNGKGFRSNTNV